jgi:urease accessory protein
MTGSAAARGPGAGPPAGFPEAAVRDDLKGVTARDGLAGSVGGHGGHSAGNAGDRTASGRAPRNRVLASAEIEAVAGPGGVTRLPVLSSQAPLVLRRTPAAVYLVGGAAGPIGGDELALRILVGAGAFLRLRTAAASIALPGPDGRESVLRVSVSVAAGGRLEYLPEPVVVSAKARHATLVSVTLAAGASLLLRDELLLGRHGETGGSARTVLRVDYAGRPLLRQSLSVSGTDPVSLGPAVLSGHRAVGSLLLVNSPDGPGGDDTGADDGEAGGGSGPGRATPERAVMPLAGPGVLVTALADDAVTLRRRLSRDLSDRV